MEIKFNKVSLLKNQSCFKKKILLDHVSFNVKEKGIYGFVGKSGSGKTEICELINFLEKPDFGLVKVGNYYSKTLKKNYNNLRFNVGYVFSNPREMFVSNKVKDELSFGLKYFKYKYKSKNKRILDSLKLVGLNDSYLTKKLNILNLADARKVALASVLTFNPKIIILDEPTIGLNNKEKNDLIRLLNILKNKYNKIVIITTKDTDFIYSFANYIYLLNNGKIVKEGKKTIMHDEVLLKSLGLSVPKIVSFVNEVRLIDKKFKYFDNVKDLAKEVYRNAR